MHCRDLSVSDHSGGVVDAAFAVDKADNRDDAADLARHLAQGRSPASTKSRLSRRSSGG